MELGGVPGPQKEEGSGHILLVEGEVLCRQDGLFQKLRRVGAQLGGDPLVERLVVPDRGISLAEVDVHRAAGLLRHRPADVLELLAAEAEGILPVGAQAPLQTGLPADGIPDLTGDHPAEPQRPGFAGGQLLHHVIGPLEIGDARRQSVPPLLCPGHVDAAPRHRDGDLIGPGHQRAGAGGDGAGGQARPQMETEDPADPVPLQHAGLTQLARAAGGLLRRLEEKENVSGQLGQVRCRVLRQGQDHGGVGVVAAGVHPPGVEGGIGQAGGLCHRQGVQLRAEGHGVALSRVEPGADAAGDGGEDAAGQRRQDPLHRLHRLRQLIVQLRDAVQGAAVIHHRHFEDLLLVRDRLTLLDHTIPQILWPEQGEDTFFVSFDKTAGAGQAAVFHFFSCQAAAEVV